MRLFPDEFPDENWVKCISAFHVLVLSDREKKNIWVLGKCIELETEAPDYKPKYEAFRGLGIEWQDPVKNFTEGFIIKNCWHVQMSTVLTKCSKEMISKLKNTAVFIL